MLKKWLRGSVSSEKEKIGEYEVIERKEGQGLTGYCEALAFSLSEMWKH